MASSSAETMMSLRTQIKDYFRFVHNLGEGDTTIAVATHDDLYWIVVRAKGAYQISYSGRGYKTEEEALQSMAQHLSDKVWQNVKDSKIPLSK